ncbi:MAG: hypothetical protein L6R39_007783 [Caloplaca ligustica]|nr:MAG: hypothetical protein L6R39_007783 [Caloplaca ligustica]
MTSSFSAPLPPPDPSNLADALVAQLRDYCLSSVLNRLLWYRDPFRPHPSGARNPL